jgi:hypothetical protein
MLLAFVGKHLVTLCVLVRLRALDLGVYRPRECEDPILCLKVYVSIVHSRFTS